MAGASTKTLLVRAFERDGTARAGRLRPSSGLRDRVVRHRGYAQHVAARARAHPRLELLDEPQLSIACFRYRPAGTRSDLDALNARILQRQRRETPYVPTSTTVHGQLALRPCYINPRTTLAEVDGLVEAVLRLGDEEAAADG